MTKVNTGISKTVGIAGMSLGIKEEIYQAIRNAARKSISKVEENIPGGLEGRLYIETQELSSDVSVGIFDLFEWDPEIDYKNLTEDEIGAKKEEAEVYREDVNRRTKRIVMTLRRHPNVPGTHLLVDYLHAGKVNVVFHEENNYEDNDHLSTGGLQLGWKIKDGNRVVDGVLRVVYAGGLSGHELFALCSVAGDIVRALKWKYQDGEIEVDIRGLNKDREVGHLFNSEIK